MLSDLYALSAIERDRAWFMEHGRLSTAAPRRSSRWSTSCAGRLRPHAADLVDAFGVPPEMLRTDLF